MLLNEIKALDSLRAGAQSPSQFLPEAERMTAPTYVPRFRDVLLDASVDRIELPISRPPINGHRGVLFTSSIHYNDQPNNILGREHEYTFPVGNTPIELSMQLYLNVSYHCAALLLLRRRDAAVAEPHASP